MGIVVDPSEYNCGHGGQRKKSPLANFHVATFARAWKCTPPSGDGSYLGHAMRKKI
jgi:hypothetical protein